MYFDESIEKFTSSGKDNVIMCDFNNDLLNCESSNYSHDFLSSLQSCYLTPAIDKPTRVRSTSATLIDNIFINNPDKVVACGNLISDISDHFSQFCTLKSMMHKSRVKKSKIRDFSRFSSDRLNADLSNVGLACKSYLDKLLKLQKRALRNIYFSDHNQHAIPLFSDASILPLHFSRYELTANLMFDIRQRNAPRNIRDLFQDIFYIRSYNTRSSASNNFYTQSSRHSIQLNSFSRIGTTIWNDMPLTLRNHSKYDFDILTSEDSYLDLRNIIQKVKFS